MKKISIYNVFIKDPESTHNLYRYKVNSPYKNILHHKEIYESYNFNKEERGGKIYYIVKYPFEKDYIEVFLIKIFYENLTKRYIHPVKRVFEENNYKLKDRGEHNKIQYEDPELEDLIDKIEKMTGD